MEYPVELFKGGESRKIENSGQEAVARAQGYTEPYKFQEYPKQLYKGGVREVHGVTGEQVSADARVVKSKAEEEAARAAGYWMLGEPEPVTAPVPAAAPAAEEPAGEAVGKDDAKGQGKAKNGK